RLWPHLLEGEGHFSALLKRDDAPGKGFAGTYECMKATKLPEEVTDFLKKVKLDLPVERMEIRENRVYLVPEGVPELNGLRIMRTGLLLGEAAKKRFEPSQALACALKASEYDNVYSLKPDDEDVIRYLKCETIEAKRDVKDGYVLVCVDDFPLGWAKASGNVLKNKYLPGWRMM
ncbi:MAG: RsmF rRNA methyltransferase first C-terminal domain-containing protein, partial [Lachnospiraceae bacterium]|nr:RsmF rRNA methyltransferase first C-terminal domain-containing protein [Lachnospiraceae bacterium]